jgi:glycosyl transferase family 1
MKKDINIVSSMVGKGLEREYLLLRALLNAHDCYVVGLHYTDYANSTLVRADVNIFLEVVMPNVFNLSRENWLCPNCEWWNPINDRFLPQFTKILCKTQDCYRLWCQKVGATKCVYTGFLSRDLYRPEIPRETKFLHVAGESEFKNTEAVIGAWRLKLIQNVFKRPPLTVVTRQKKYQDLCEGVEGVTCITRASEEELVQLMNSHLFHLIPSAYEGFGHALHEGVGCGALVITTDAPPMSEVAGIVQEWKVPVVGKYQRSLAQLNQVSAESVLGQVRRATVAAKGAFNTGCTDPKFMTDRQESARKAFLEQNESFSKKFLSLVGVA